MRRTFLLLLFLVPAPSLVRAQRTTTGRIQGQVSERGTGQVLPGASIWIEPLGRGDVSDAEGRFRIGSLPAGRYSVHVRFLGFGPASRGSVEVHPGRTTTVDFELGAMIYDSEELVVTADYFDRERSEAAAIAVFDAETIRSGAGTAGDVQRLLAGMPSVARSDDMRNALAVRGGSPMENRFLVDGIPVPNLNHFPTQGSTGGAIGLLSPELISSVVFRTGGFGTEHFDRLSSVIELNLREPRDTAGQIDFGLAGFGAVGEGSVGGVRLLGSVRRSWVDVLAKNFLKEQADAIPVYGDAVLRASWSAGKHRFVALDVLGIDRSGLDRDSALDTHENMYGKADFTANVLGARWQWLWGRSGFSQTAISHSRNGQSLEFMRTADGEPLQQDQSTHAVTTVLHTTRYVASPRLRFKFGFDADTERLEGSRGRSRLGIHAAASIGRSLRLEPGFRVDRYGEHTLFQPRISLSFTAPESRIWISGGRYAQALPLALIASSPSLSETGPLTAVHLILGASWTLGAATLLSAEAYSKTYTELPSDPDSPLVFALDRLYDESLSLPLWPKWDSAEASARARSRGVEITLRKALASGFYGLLAVGWSRAEYRDAMGAWHRRRFDNRFVGTVDGGWRLSDTHSVSLRWTYAGGRPYTAIDEKLSAASGRQILDQTRVMDRRLAAYHALSGRYDLRVPVRQRFLVAYASIWNVYNQKNISGFYWDEVGSQVRARLQWGLLPIIGLELEL
jgi:carboxypeptidase family protein/TonB-dependent receptor-like protein